MSEEKINASPEPEALLASLLTLEQGDSAGTVIQPLLALLGQIYEADRVSIFEFDRNGDTATNTYEWCGQGITSDRDKLQGVPIEQSRVWRELFGDKDFITLKEVAAGAPAESLVQQLLRMRKMTNLRVMPLKYQGTLIGFVSVGNARRHIDDAAPLLSTGEQICRDVISRRAVEAQLLSGLAGIFSGVYLYDYRTDRSVEFRGTLRPSSGPAVTEGTRQGILGLIDSFVAPEYREIMSQYYDFTWLQTRLRDRKIVSVDFLTQKVGWRRMIAVAVERDETGLPTKVLTAYQDINDQKAQERSFSYRIEHDSLTDLYNRNGFDRISSELRDTPHAVAVVVLDLDNFKAVNDTFGHSTGDRTLCFTAEVLRNAFRAADYVFRYGGDEFVAVMILPCPDVALSIERRIGRINSLLQDPPEGLPPVTMSAGMAVSRSGYHDGLLEQADGALYEAKAAGKRCFRCSKE